MCRVHTRCGERRAVLCSQTLLWYQEPWLEELRRQGRHEAVSGRLWMTCLESPCANPQWHHCMVAWHLAANRCSAKTRSLPWLTVGFHNYACMLEWLAELWKMPTLGLHPKSLIGVEQDTGTSIFLSSSGDSIWKPRLWLIENRLGEHHVS